MRCFVLMLTLSVVGFWILVVRAYDADPVRILSHNTTFPFRVVNTSRIAYEERDCFAFNLVCRNGPRMERQNPQPSNT